MKCLKMIFGMVCIAFTFIISQEIIVNNTYAVDDISVTYTSIPSAYDDVFPTCTGDCLNDYSYLIIQITQPDYSTFSYFRLDSRFNGSSSSVLTFSSSTSFAIYQLPFNGSSNNYLQFMSNYSSALFSSGITFTLTESYQSGITPSGSLSITENGTYDVTNYAEAVVNVSTSSGGGDNPYHQDLVNIYYAIITCGAICLVLYFFYCIYRMIIKSTGGK